MSRSDHPLFSFVDPWPSCINSVGPLRCFLNGPVTY